MSFTPTSIEAGGRSLAERAPELMREKLAGYADRYCDALMAAVDDPYCRAHASALRIYPQIMRAVGSEQDVALALLTALGVRDQIQLAALVDTARQAEGTTLEAATQQAFQLLARRIRTEPGFREDAARTLFGIELAAPASWAVVAEDNSELAAESGQKGEPK